MSLVVRFVHGFIVFLRVEKSVQRGTIVVKKIGVVVIHWLHLEHKIAIACVDILWVEDTAIGLKTTACLMPATAVECIKVISPVENELTSVNIIVEDLNVVVKDIPWHVNWVEAISPRVEGWGPEVHSKGLILLHELDRWIVGRNMADFVTVDGPADVLWGP